MPFAATGSGESVFVIVTSAWLLGSGVAVGVFEGVGVSVGVFVIVGVFVTVGVGVFVRVGEGVDVNVGGVPHVIDSDSGCAGVPAAPSECFVDVFCVKFVAPAVPCTIVTVPKPFTPGHWKSPVPIRPVYVEAAALIPITQPKTTVPGAAPDASNAQFGQLPPTVGDAPASGLGFVPSAGWLRNVRLE